MRRSFYRYGAAPSISIGGQIAAGPAILTELCPRTLWTFVFELPPPQQTPACSVKELSGVSERPMIHPVVILRGSEYWRTTRHLDGVGDAGRCLPGSHGAHRHDSYGRPRDARGDGIARDVFARERDWRASNVRRVRSATALGVAVV